MRYYYECKKVLGNRFLLLAFLGLILLNGCNIVLEYKESRQQDLQDTIDMLDEQLEGKLTQEKYNFVIDNYNRLTKIIEDGDYSTEYNPADTLSGYDYGDYNLFVSLYDRFFEIYHYPQQMEAIIEAANENVHLYTRFNNSTYTAENELLVSIYKDRSISSYYNFSGYEQYFSYDLSALFVLVLCILLLSSMFSTERESGMELILNVAEKGKSRLTVVKLVTGIGLCLFAALIFFLEDWLLFKILYGLKGSFLPIYAVPMFQYSPLNCTIHDYTLLSSLIKFEGVLFFSLFVFCVSKLSKSTLVTCAIAGFSLFFFILTSEWNDNILFENLNPVSFFISRRNYVNFETTLIRGQVMLKGVVQLFAGILLPFIMLLLALLSEIRLPAIHKGK